MNQADEDGATPLFIAAHQGHFTVAQLLIDYEAKVNLAMSNGATPLFL